MSRYLDLVPADRDCEPEDGPFDCPNCHRDMRTADGFLACPGCHFADHGPDCDPLIGCTCGLIAAYERSIEGDRADDEARGITRGWEAALS